jgi:hypothetical protein
MAHYAYINQYNLVVAVIVGKDENELIDGMQPEIYYAQGTPYTVKRTSYNNKIRGVYAGVGYSYDENEDIFIVPKPYPSWTRLGSYWNAPIEKPQGFNWSWDESTLSWVEIETLA